MALFKKFRKKKVLLFIREVHMELPSYMHIGSRLTIVRHTECMLAMEFSSIMKALGEVKLL